MNNICHIEYYVTDLDKAQSFYGGLFGWNFRSFVEGMVIFGNGDDHIGGLMKTDKVEAGRSPSIWFKVADIDEMVSKTRFLGGATPHEKEAVPGVGWSVLVRDPDGNDIGLVQYD
jgi:hypothetical protein